MILDCARFICCMLIVLKFHSSGTCLLVVWHMFKEGNLFEIQKTIAKFFMCIMWFLIICMYLVVQKMILIFLKYEICIFCDDSLIVIFQRLKMLVSVSSMCVTIEYNENQLVVFFEKMPRRYYLRVKCFIWHNIKSQRAL